LKQNIKIKVDKPTPRITYTCDFVFKERGLSYTLVTDDQDFDVDYTQQGLASALLYETNIRVEIPEFDVNKLVLLFDGKPDFFASIFYVLTRMEEYIAPDKDEHGRFGIRQSILFKYGLINLAICDRWAHHIIGEIAKKEVPEPVINFEPTFDIDNAYAYLHKTGIRRKLSIIRDRLKGDKERISERRRVRHGDKDPYANYEVISEIAKKHSVKIFWLMESHGKFDRNLDINLAEHQGLIRKMSKQTMIGIHPSYGSFGQPEVIKLEKERLEQIIRKPVIHSRQHFLRFSLPDTYHALIENGIEHDYSMGFAGETGFRIGTARSVQWFDLTTNSQSDLTIHPFVYMDGTLNEYLSFTIREAKSRITALFEEVKRNGGTFRFIWHNETIGGYKHWKGWESVLEHTLILMNE